MHSRLRCQENTKHTAGKSNIGCIRHIEHNGSRILIRRCTGCGTLHISTFAVCIPDFKSLQIYAGTFIVEYNGLIGLLFNPQCSFTYIVQPVAIDIISSFRTFRNIDLRLVHHFILILNLITYLICHTCRYFRYTCDQSVHINFQSTFRKNRLLAFSIYFQTQSVFYGICTPDI